MEKYVELINTVSHFADTKHQLKEATAVIGILKNDVKGNIIFIMACTT
jgi:hypothetical protein